MRFCSITTQSVTPSGRPTKSATVRRLYPSSAMACPQQGTGFEIVRASSDVDQTMVTVHHAHGEPILSRVVVAPQIGEEPLHPAPRSTTEQIRQLSRTLGVRMAFGEQGARMAQRSRHRVQLHDDVHAAEEVP